MTKKELQQEREWSVRKSNDMVRHARYRLTLTQQRMLLYIISKIKPASKEQGSAGDSPDTEYTFDIRKFCQVAGLKLSDGGYYYRDLKKQLEGIDSFKAWIPTPTGGIQRFQWFNTIEIEPSTGVFKISFHKTAQPYLFELYANYTRYPIEEVLPFKSRYSVRLYEILRSFAWQKKLEKDYLIPISYTPEELRSLLDAENKVIGTNPKTGEEITQPILKQYSEFRVKVLNVAVEEINKFSTMIQVDYDQIKHGNKVTAIQFYVRPKKAREYIEAKANRNEWNDK